MASPFAALENLVSDSVDELYAERTRILPMAAGRVSRVADGDRAIVDAMGVVDFNPVLAKAQDLGQYDGYQPTADADRIHVSYADTEFPAGTRKDDEIELLEPERGGQKLRITRVDPDGLGRFVCVCVIA